MATMARHSATCVAVAQSVGADWSTIGLLSVLVSPKNSDKIHSPGSDGRVAWLRREQSNHEVDSRCLRNASSDCATRVLSVLQQAHLIRAHSIICLAWYESKEVIGILKYLH